MVDPILGVIGGPTKEEAREYLKLKKNPKNTKSSCKQIFLNYNTYKVRQLGRTKTKRGLIMDPQDVGDGVDDRMTVEEVEIFPAIAEDEFRTKMEEIDRFLQSREKGIT